MASKDRIPADGNPSGDVPREHLESEVARLQVQVDALTGDAERREQAALTNILYAIRENVGDVTQAGNRDGLLYFACGLVDFIPGEHATVEEFAARASQIARKWGGE